jgi:hypothetical protein
LWCVSVVKVISQQVGKFLEMWEMTINNKMYLPAEIKALVLEFHDEYNVIEKKMRINFIIRNGFYQWCNSKMGYDALWSPFVYHPPYLVFPSRKSEWYWFLGTILGYEEDLIKYPFYTTRMNLLL